MSQETVRQKRGEQVRLLILETAIDLVFEAGFRSVGVESIAARSGVAKTTIYRRWPNKAAVVMDAFMMRVGSGTLFPPRGRRRIGSGCRWIRWRRCSWARMAAWLEVCWRSGVRRRAGGGFRERWTLPRRAMAVAVFREAIERGELRREIDPETAIDLLYAPQYYRLQMGTEICPRIISRDCSSTG